MGPGFDTMSLSLAGCGDVFTMEPAGSDRIAVTGPGAEEIPTGWDANVVGAVVDYLRRTTATEDSFAIHIEKPRPGGSGLGSSASSAAGAALAFHHLHPEAGLGTDDLVAAALLGEQVAGGGNPDDIGAVVLGGMSLVCPTPRGPMARRVDPPRDLVLGVVAPELSLPTAQMRALLPDAWPRDAVLHNLGLVGAMVDACHRDDVAAFAQCMRDQLHTPYRAAKWPHFEACRDAALAAGAPGACISGSGPALVAATHDEDVARAAAEAMVDALESVGLKGQGFVARPEWRKPHAGPLSPL